MRNVVYAINLTIDGCCDHTKGMPDEELHFFWADLLRAAGVLAYGRVTYELMVPYWPEIAKNPSGQTKAGIEFARVFDTAEKVVFSKSLNKVDDKNSRIVRTSPAEEILKMKQEEGKKIFLGGVALPSYLIKLGLVDEFIFAVQPIIAGEGRRLLNGTGLPEQLSLNLIDSKVLKSGCTVLHYLKK